MNMPYTRTWVLSSLEVMLAAVARARALVLPLRFVDRVCFKIETDML